MEYVGRERLLDSARGALIEAIGDGGGSGIDDPADRIFDQATALAGDRG